MHELLVAFQVVPLSKFGAAAVARERGQFKVNTPEMIVSVTNRKSHIFQMLESI
jgi:hypothetical protein